MSDSSENESNNEQNDNSSQLAFVLLIKQEPILLSKSQTPSVKTAKVEALNRFLKACQVHFGKVFTAEQIRKKINNMKTEIKKKTDMKATGNKKIILKNWEQEFLKLLDTEGTNPSVSSIPGGVATLNLQVQKEGQGPSIVLDSSENISKNQSTHQKKRLKLEKYETEETKHLTTTELQRLVLLEQLQYIREKRQKLNEQKVVNEDGKTYTSL